MIEFLLATALFLSLLLSVQSLALLMLPFLFSVPLRLIVAQFCEREDDFSDPFLDGNVEKFLAKVGLELIGDDAVTAAAYKSRDADGNTPPPPLWLLLLLLLLLWMLFILLLLLWLELVKFEGALYR